ncbi:MAG: sugar ABC transporter substrate-binding protein [Clostridiales bacterium]|nr:sugar ABC transporter substrate-binding protein [Clostridiales bacterium]
MKKKILSLALATAMVFTLGACGSSSSSDTADTTDDTAEEVSAEAETGDESGLEASIDSVQRVAFCTFTTEGDFWYNYYTMAQDDFASDGVTMDIISANNDLDRQIEQIENCLDKGYDLIIEIAVDSGEGLQEVNQEVMDAGIPIVQFIKDSGEGYRTSFRGTDETAVGGQIVETAMDWVNEAFPDAADGSINTVIIGGNSAGSETERFEAIVDKAAEYPQLNVVDAVQWETSQNYAQGAAASEIAQFDGDVQLILAASGEMALGVRDSIISGGTLITDYSDFGIFTCDMSDDTAVSISGSVTDEDVIRGAVVVGEDSVDNILELVDTCMEILNGEDYDEFVSVDISVCTADNLADFGY